MKESLHVLHMADTHLGHRQYGLVERENDIYHVFTETVEIALREHVDAVVHAGDLFDSPRPMPQSILAAVKNLSRLREKGIPFITVMGDHDVPRRRQLPPHAVLQAMLGDSFVHLGAKPPGDAARRVRTRSGELYVAGLANRKGVAARQQLLELLRRLPKPPGDTASVLVLHQGLQEAIPFDYELSLGDLPRGYSYYALGHVHVTRIYRLGDAAAAYPGSIEALNREEARQQRERYVLLAELSPGSSRVEKIRLTRTRPQPYYEIKYGDEKSFSSQLARIVEELRRLKGATGLDPLVHIVVENVPGSRKATVYSLIERSLRGVALHYRAEIRTREEEELLRRAKAAAGSQEARVGPLEALRELLGSDELAELAYRLAELLSGKQGGLVEAERLVRSYFGLDE